MPTRTPSILKDLEHRNACVGHTGKDKSRTGNGKPELQATAIRSRFVRQCRRASRHNMSVMHVLVTQAKIRVTQAMGSQSCGQQQYALDLSGNVGAEVRLGRTIS
jgi:hypothetical protein